MELNKNDARRAPEAKGFEKKELLDGLFVDVNAPDIDRLLERMGGLFVSKQELQDIEAKIRMDFDYAFNEHRKEIKSKINKVKEVKDEFDDSVLIRASLSMPLGDISESNKRVLITRIGYYRFSVFVNDGTEFEVDGKVLPDSEYITYHIVEIPFYENEFFLGNLPIDAIAEDRQQPNIKWESVRGQAHFLVGGSDEYRYPLGDIERNVYISRDNDFELLKIFQSSKDE